VAQAEGELIRYARPQKFSTGRDRSGCGGGVAVGSKQQQLG